MNTTSASTTTRNTALTRAFNRKKATLIQLRLRLRAIQLPPMGHDYSWVGKRLQFWGSGKDVVTSPVIDVARPERDDLERYVSREQSGLIAA